MAQYNPMLVRLQQKIEEHNKYVQQTIDKVAPQTEDHYYRGNLGLVEAT